MSKEKFMLIVSVLIIAIDYVFYSHKGIFILFCMIVYLSILFVD